jgi:periplasmic divalent cation tolerance protein
MLEMHDNMGITVYTTTPDEKCAEEIAKGVVKAKLAACCNFLCLRTVYSWEGELKDDTEHVLFIKTSKDKFEELEKYIVNNHPYSMPAIVSLPWDDAHEPYKNWVEKNE